MLSKGSSLEPNERSEVQLRDLETENIEKAEMPRGGMGLMRGLGTV